ncbi:Annexin repeat, partial [Dillenia turbinata]
LSGARRAYHFLFDHSIEEDVACHGDGPDFKARVNVAKIESKVLHNAIKNGDSKKPSKDDDIMRILSTRSNLHLMILFNYYKEIAGKSIVEDLDVDTCLEEMVECLYAPQTYFSRIKRWCSEGAKRTLIRVIVTSVEVDMNKIKEEYNNVYRVFLFETIECKAQGNFKNLFFTLVGKV